MEAYENVRQIDRASKIADSPSQDVDGCHCDTIQTRDFAVLIARRPPEYWDRSVGITYRRFHQWFVMLRVLPVLDWQSASVGCCVMTFAQQNVFTLE